MAIKMFGNDIKKVFFQDKEIKAVYFQGKNLFSSINYYYKGFWNLNNNNFESVEIVLMENGYIKFIIDNGSWDFWCDNNPNATIDNPCVCYNVDNSALFSVGSIYSNLNIFWSKTAECWVCRVNSLEDSDSKKYRYIARDMDMARALPTTNRANLIL